MRQIIATLVLAASSLAVCAADVVPGVSRALARERKECVDSVKYNLNFHYPHSGESRFYVDEEIRFHYKGGLTDFLQIDFEGEGLDACVVNDVEISPEWRDNHILIPAELLTQGENRVRLKCWSSDKALNSNPDFMYTLFVPGNAHSAFPCFDQPDLKANFTPTLILPSEYKCLSTMGIKSDETTEIPGYKSVKFKESPLLPTYLMSWVIGDFQEAGDGTVRALYKETDPAKLAQIPEMCRISAQALKWLEEYTGIAYPFEKYDFAVIPGFQFGGMEHPGAILYNPVRTLLGETPTPEELLSRYELIAHETSHMWFGDLVTMRWFDDVWTKEVFANFLASKISSEAFPEIDHNFNFIRANYPWAYYTDRTDGTHPIAQNLDNLNGAGLLYGNIIYNKAPIMMRMLEKRIGEQRLREGLSAYLRKYAMGNSSWDELIAILDSVAPEADLKGFSEAWVKRKGMPTITAEFNKDNQMLTVIQSDPTGSGTLWPQTFSVKLIGTEGTKEVSVDLFEQSCTLPVDTSGLGSVTSVFPNSHGEGYGYFKIGESNAYFDAWPKLDNDGRYAAVLNLRNAWAQKDIDNETLKANLLSLFPTIDNPIIAAAVADLLASMNAQNETGEEVLWEAFDTTAHPSVKQKLLRSLYSQSVTEPSVSRLYQIWREQSEPLMNPSDYMAMAYRLAILKPAAAGEILQEQRGRIADNANLVREFDFISRACKEEPDVLLDTLQTPENRRPEPWTTQMLALILDPSRSPSTGQIQRALDMLPEIQTTGGIFFPTQWIKAVMSGIRSEEARKFLVDYCEGINPADPLYRKLLEQSYLTRQHSR